MKKIEQILKEKYAMISIIGPHAGEPSEEIFERKIEDTEKVGKTFWVINSHQAKPEIVQNFCKQALEEQEMAHCMFVTPSSKGGAKKTSTSEEAKKYSKNGEKWKGFPEKLSRVTGRLKKSTCGLVFNDLRLVGGKIVDLGNYADFQKPAEPLKIRQGNSTVCGIRKDMHSHPDVMKSIKRKILAVGTFEEPYGVELKK